MDENSHEIFDLKNNDIVLRIYKMASFTHISDMRIKMNEL